LRQIEEEYIQKGLVRFGYHHQIILGIESQYAAEASECASDQGAFWIYHDRLFEELSGKNQGRFSMDNLKRFADELGLEPESFNTCLDSRKYESAVKSQSRTASSLGLRSTPSFLINGQPVFGAQPFETFQQYIEPYISR
jgi:protein-disulfide isomerase